jgi:putative ABC transport system permease protein
LGNGLALDIRAGIRALLASRANSAPAALTLALAVGAMTALFTVVNGLILRPLPVGDPQRLVTITSETALRFGFQAGAGWSYAMWERLRERAGAFDGAFAWILEPLDLAQTGESQPIEGLFASGDFFRTLGVQTMAGRTFTGADDVRGGGPDGAVAVISYELWQRRFNGAASVVGSRLSIEGAPVTIVGIAPRGFRGVDIGQPFDIALPLGIEPLIRDHRSVVDNRGALLLTVMLRRKPAQSLSEATARLRAMQAGIVGTDVPRMLKEPFVLIPAATGISDRSRLRQQYERPLVTLSIVAGLMLLIVCVNVANLFLARAAARRHDLSVQLAVGAPRWRLARQLFVEGLSLGGVSAIAGLIFAVWASRALVTQLPAAGQPIVLDLPIDWRVVAFIGTVAIATVVLFVTAPAVYAARVPSIEALQEERSAGSGRQTGVVTGVLIVAQVALSIVLVAAAGVFARTLNRLASVPLGFDPSGLIVMTVNPPRSARDVTERIRVYDRVLDATAAVPDVILAAGSTWTPFGPGGGGLLTDARGRRADLGPQVAFNFVSKGWFATYGTALRAGRDFDDRDGAGAPRVAIVNEALRRSISGGANIIGTTIDAGPCGRSGCSVIGVVADALYSRSLRDLPPPTVYLPFAQSAGVGPSEAPFRISIRAGGHPARLIPTLTDKVRAVAPDLTLTFRALDRDVTASLAQERLVAVLAGFFGAVALLLSAIGLYGVTSFAVSRRRGEIGIRLALGGQPLTIVRALITRIGVFVLAGTALGAVTASWLSHFIAPLVYGLEPRDPATLAASTGILASIAVIAALLPAWRGTRVEPAQSLRQH